MRAKIIIITSVQSNLAKGRIVILSPLAAANALVRRVRRAGTFARSGRRTMRNALMCRHIKIAGTCVPSKCLYRGELNLI